MNNRPDGGAIRLPELLAPAGSADALRAAVAAGADAVYVGLGMFNARAANAGLTLEELAHGCAVAHAHGARVYVTLNVYVRDSELEDAVLLASRALAVGADALIVADAGLMLALRDALPSVELHLSTQAGVQDAAGALLAAREFGVSRVTCARELSVDELADLCAAGVPVEAFCHGAICICYSGACEFSWLDRGRSANRGDCTQPCRMAYGLVDAAGRELASDVGERLLCPRDYLSIRHVLELVRAGVAALKIEGRMKNPDYVFNVVRCYRTALDALAARHELDETELDELEVQLGRSFNRGFTDAYLRGTSGSELMSFERAINQGIPVGRVVARGHEEVTVAFDAAVHVGDTLEIRSTPGEDAAPDVPKRWPMVPCPANAAAGERLLVHCKRRVEVGSAVHVVRSAQVLAEAEAAVAAMRAEEAMQAEEERLVAAAAGVCRATVAEEFEVGRPEDARTVRAGCGAVSLGELVTGGESGALMPAASPVVAWAPAEASRMLRDHPDCEVAACAHRLLEADSSAWEPLLPRLTVILDEVNRAADASRARVLCAKAGRVICRNLGQIDLAREAGASWDAAPPISVWNTRTARWLRGMGAQRIWLPPELSEADAHSIAAQLDSAVPIGFLEAGPQQFMVTEHCMLTAEGPCAAVERGVSACAACARRLASQRGERILVQRERTSAGAKLPVFVDALGRTRIYASRPVE